MVPNGNKKSFQKHIRLDKFLEKDLKFISEISKIDEMIFLKKFISDGIDNEIGKIHKKATEDFISDKISEEDYFIQTKNRKNKIPTDVKKRRNAYLKISLEKSKLLDKVKKEIDEEIELFKEDIYENAKGDVAELIKKKQLNKKLKDSLMKELEDKLNHILIKKGLITKEDLIE